MKNSTIPVFFTIDNAFAPYLSVALISAVKNADPKRSYRAIILHDDLTEDSIAALASLGSDNFEITFERIDDRLSVIENKLGHTLNCSHFTLTIYYRLLIPNMFPEYDKGIYIDSDVVVEADLGKLFDTDLGNNLIAACADTSVLDVPQFTHYMEEAVGVSRFEYVNSGVLLMNLRELRECGFEHHFFRLLKEYSFDCVAPDQDYLNAICNGRIHYLPAAWDAMPNPNHEPIGNPCIVHYNLFYKPWRYDGVQYGDRFWKYAAFSPYHGFLFDFNRSYGDDKKERDATCLCKLIDQARVLSQSEKTFRKAAARGERIRL